MSVYGKDSGQDTKDNMEKDIWAPSGKNIVAREYRLTRLIIWLG